MIGSKRRLLACAIPILLYGLALSYNLSYFYGRGAAVYDAGWFAWLSKNSVSWPMPNPGLIGGNFLSIHMSPFFFIASFAAKFFPGVPYSIWFCVWFSTWLPLLWVAIYALLSQVSFVSPGSRVFGATLLTLNGISLSMLGFPHIESFIPPLMILLFVLALRVPAGRSWAAIGMCICLLILLCVREDAGLHTCLAFMALALLAKDNKVSILVAVAGLTASLLALLAQHRLPGGGHSLGNIYLGQPAFSGLGVRRSSHRVLYWATARAYIFGPLGLLALMAAWWRDRKLALGVLLALPWLALSFVAVSPMAGDLWGYYAFPLIVPCLWPLFVLCVSPPLEIARARRLYRLQLAGGVLSSLCFVTVGILPGMGQGGAFDSAPWRHFAPPGVGQIMRTEAAMRALESRPEFATTIMDDGAASLALDDAAPGQFSLGLDPSGLNLAGATQFLRFDKPLPYAAVAEADLSQKFPACTTISGTALEVCKGLSNAAK